VYQVCSTVIATTVKSLYNNLNLLNHPEIPKEFYRYLAAASSVSKGHYC
tara:strand:+ start:268 stop:414 length:147 start_codon:yes stop_codon:yes gene_type:complete